MFHAVRHLKLRIAKKSESLRSFLSIRITFPHFGAPALFLQPSGLDRLAGTVRTDGIIQTTKKPYAITHTVFSKIKDGIIPSPPLHLCERNRFDNESDKCLPVGFQD